MIDRADAGIDGFAMATISHLSWTGDVLYFGHRKLMRIVRDAKYANMWRVEFPDGRLSNMVNRAGAKDAAMMHGRRIVDPK
jgi:hypothetical protein